MDDVLELTGVTRRFGRAGPVALRGVSLRVPAGSFVSVMGATGSGKSTLLHCAAGLDSPTSGDVELAGRSLRGLDETALTLTRTEEIDGYERGRRASLPTTRRTA